MIAVLLIIFITGIIILTTNPAFIGKKSIHTDARKYKTRHCLAFYPDGNSGLENARNLCKGVKDDRVYDYQLIPYGDYYQISYGNDLKYFTDKQFNSITLNELDEDGKKILIDYLRYEIKKNDTEKYYDSSFLASLDIDDVDFSKISYELENDTLKVRYEEYGYECNIPLKYLQKSLKMNFGFPNELYRRPVYIDKDEKHPIICLTFNDGPDFEYSMDVSSSVKIVDLLYRYDACATFYSTGEDLKNLEVWADYQIYHFLKRSIANGNTYGSLTENRVDLTEIESDRIRAQIMGPIEYLEDLLGYRMMTYRPLSGAFDQSVLENQPVPAILWNIDSLDWMYDDSNDIYDTVMNSDLETGDIIIMHDIHDETYEALEKIVPELIDKGYQLLTVEDMLKAFDIDISSLEYFYNPNYYE